ncbi:MAG: hypothetical protein KGJ61_09280 [Candidatus Omnitrophica bacterium]|nr:hypothetical protein [Candidatus Omnitrophota bacterium]
MIKKRAQLSEENRPLLWVELILFSVISGLVCHSWLGFVIVVSVLTWLMSRRNGMLYFLLAISLMWAFISFAIGLSFGWIAALVIGGISFLMAARVHINGLKWYWDELVCKQDDSIEWRRFTWYGAMH